MDGQESIGQTLRRRREERGLSVEQAAHQSKVPIRLVEALESDDYHLLPDALYLIRLLHDYATLLQLDAAAIEAEFRQAVRRPPHPSLAPPSASRPDPAIPWKQMLWTMLAILVVTPLVFIALSLASKRAQEREARGPDSGSARRGVATGRRRGRGGFGAALGERHPVRLFGRRVGGRGGAATLCSGARDADSDRHGRRREDSPGAPCVGCPRPRADLVVDSVRRGRAATGPPAVGADGALRGGGGISRDSGQCRRCGALVQRRTAPIPGPVRRGRPGSHPAAPARRFPRLGGRGCTVEAVAGRGGDRAWRAG